MNSKKHEALALLIQLAQKQGYLLFDDMVNIAEKYNLTIQDVTWVSTAVAEQGILVYDEDPMMTAANNYDDYDDFARTDYEDIFRKVVVLSPSQEQFINDVRNIIPPQHLELKQLKYQAVNGNQYARRRMIEMHLRVAVRIALRRTEMFDADIDDMIGDACVGLINAVEKYNSDTNGHFTPYASFWIFQNMTRAQGTCRPLVYYPVQRKYSFYTIYPILKKHGCIGCQELHECREVMAIICKKLNCTEKQAKDVITACMPLESLESLLEDIGSCGDYEKYKKIKHVFIVNEFGHFENIYNDIREDLLLQIKKILTEREMEVILARYGFDDDREKTLEDVGRIFGVTRERIRQIEVKALRKLRHSPQSRKLKDFL